MSGLALADVENIVHWAPFSDHTQEELQRIIDDGDIEWGVLCEAYGEGMSNPKIVKPVSQARKDVTCFMCLQCLADADDLDR